MFLGTTEVPFLKAKPAFDILVPAVLSDFSTTAPVPAPSASHGGIGDLLIGPALQFDPIMGEKGPLFVHRLEFQFIIPTGQYSASHQINPGSNFFSFEPYWAGTLFLGEKTAASFRTHYLWNAQNNNPSAILGANVKNTRAGEAFHANFTLDHEIIEKKLRVGLNGYWLQQTTNAEANGASVPNTRERVVGIGPGFLLSFSERSHLFFNYFWEMGAENRPEGNRLTLRYVHKF